MNYLYHTLMMRFHRLVAVHTPFTGMGFCLDHALKAVYHHLRRIGEDAECP